MVSSPLLRPTRLIRQQALTVAAVALVAAGCSGAVLDATPGSSPAATPSSVVESPGDGRSASPDALVTTIERIVDGDTLYVADLEERVRLIGIDAPETQHPDQGVECFGREASAHLGELVPPGTEVRVVFDVERVDRYDRPLGYLYRTDDDLFVNLAMVADGYAMAYTVPPNVEHAEEFVAAQRDAREAGRGLWSACGER
ncbi:MAG: thermonuclease family protein [Nitriliruptorales bacterium]|nr:thermonuclease family protein [Nitriliruptorales bacterium]